MTSFICPKCGAGLGGRAGGVSACLGCRGVFVPREVAANLFREMQLGAAPIAAGGGSPYRSAPAMAKPKDQLEEGPTRYIACPACSELMNRTRLGRRKGFVVDICLRHGIWFDPGELEAAAALLSLSETDLETQVGQVLALFLKR